MHVLSDHTLVKLNIEKTIQQTDIINPPQSLLLFTIETCTKGCSLIYKKKSPCTKLFLLQLSDDWSKKLNTEVTMNAINYCKYVHMLFTLEIFILNYYMQD